MALDKGECLVELVEELERSRGTKTGRRKVTQCCVFLIFPA